MTTGKRRLAHAGIGIALLSAIMLLAMYACTAEPEPAPTADDGWVPAFPTATPALEPEPLPSATPDSSGTCSPATVDYLVDMAGEIETLIRSAEQIDYWLVEAPDKLSTKATVAKELLVISAAAATIASTTPPAPFPAVYKAIADVAHDFKRALESDDSHEMIVQAYVDAGHAYDQIAQRLAGCGVDIVQGWGPCGHCGCVPHTKGAICK